MFIIDTIGLPSGQIIEISENDIKSLQDMNLINWIGGNLGYTFFDNNYLKIINYLNKNEDELNFIRWLKKEYPDQDDWINIKEIDCFNNQLTSLKGIEKLINLKKLDCSKNNLTSLKGIEKLVNLEYLTCSKNNLTSLKGIEKLVNLEYLTCFYNQLTSLKGIENLFNLKLLNCQHNQLTSLIEVYNLNNLKNLYCDNNNFSDNYIKHTKKLLQNIILVI